VTRADALDDGEIRGSAPALPVLDEPVQENAPADALNDQQFGPSRCWKRRDRLLEGVEQLVGEGSAEVEGAPQRVVQRRDVVDGATRERTQASTSSIMNLHCLRVR